MITSTQNPRIKHLLLLQQKSSLRKEEGLFVVEGRREVEHRKRACSSWRGGARWSIASRLASRFAPLSSVRR